MSKINDKKVIDINKYPRTIKFKSSKEIFDERRKRREKLIAETLLIIEAIRNRSK
ncbi:hypothetical protein [Neobacillus sp. PS3-40]|uniref:hypothetical protein n=1 Tax=Neobacillus sp. PS3-40 TaxID=3070679 RepID=UPI0027DF4F35|nr:hypothetical protein [Neobacillus sp. PS3-40]WML43125.1 hypothetical protein RCG20_15120 [Neobacillus sp. PS3-40]